MFRVNGKDVRTSFCVVIVNFEYVQLFSLISVNLMSRFEDGGTWVDKAISDGLAHLLPGHL